MNPNDKIKRKSVSDIIKWYKGRCKFEINRFQDDVFFSWHSRFYDRIIRNKNEFINVRNYIINNPRKFKMKKLN
jgi:hypothetical protein